MKEVLLTSAGTLTILPVEGIFTRQFRRILSADDTRVIRLERDVCTCVLLGEMLDDLVARSFARSVANVARLDYLACSGRDIDNDSWTGRRECQELLDDVEGSDDVGIKSELVVCCGDLSARNEGMRCRDVRDQDVNFADFLYDGRNAVEIGDGRGVCGDFGVWILDFEFLLRFAENLLSSLDEDEMLNVGFGEGLRDGEADAACLQESVAVEPRQRGIYEPPPVISTVLSFPS